MRTEARIILLPEYGLDGQETQLVIVPGSGISYVYSVPAVDHIM